MNLSFLNSVSPLEAALYYATELNLKVFPLHNAIEGEWIDVSIDGKPERILRCSCGNTSCGKQTGKHPRFKDNLNSATGDPVKIKQWWTQWPKANIGIVTGNQLIVIDVDQRHGGLKSIQEVFTYSPNLKNTLIASTGDGGFHYYAKVPLAAGKIGSRVGVWDGIDIRGDGGYVVAAPSLHRKGRRYQWMQEESSFSELDVKFLEKIRRQLSETTDLLLKAESSTKIPEGQRNDTLFRIACQKCSIRWAKEETLAHITRQNHERCDPPLSSDEVAKIVENAYNYNPAYLCNDEGNSQRLYDIHGRNFRWVPSFKWLHWEEGHWERMDEQEVLSYAVELCHQIRVLAIAKSDEELASWMHKSLNEKPLGAMTRIMRAKVFLDATEINRKPLWLPLANGVYEIDNGLFRTARREDYILQRSPVDYDETADCPLWKESLLRWMDGDQTMVDFLQRMSGYFLTGDARHHCLFIFWGSGANGKSTFTRVLEALLGPFSIAMSTDMLLRRTTISKEQEAARLFGARLAICSESPENATLDTEAAKSLTGGDRVRGKIVYNEPFEFEPTHKIVLHTNELPKLTYNDYAAWRRIKLIHFPVRIPEDERDPALPQKLQRELPGILNWALEGARSWLAQGDLRVPAKVEDATKQYREGQDQIGVALEEIAEFGSDEPTSDYRVKKDQLYRRYTAICTTWGQRPKSKGGFYDYMAARPGIREVNKGGSLFFVGVKLKEASGDIDLER